MTLRLALILGLLIGCNFSSIESIHALDTYADLEQSLQALKTGKTKMTPANEPNCSICVDCTAIFEKAFSILYSDFNLKHLLTDTNDHSDKKDLLYILGGEIKPAPYFPKHKKIFGSNITLCSKRLVSNIPSYTFNGNISSSDHSEWIANGNSSYMLTPETTSLEFLLMVLHETLIKFDSDVLYNAKHQLELAPINQLTFITNHCFSDEAILQQRNRIIFNAFRAYVVEEKILADKYQDNPIYKTNSIYQKIKKFRLNPTKQNCQLAFMELFNHYSHLPTPKEKQEVAKDILKNYDCKDNSVWIFRKFNNGYSIGGPRPDPKGG